jgi:hypothetical protein
MTLARGFFGGLVAIILLLVLAAPTPPADNIKGAYPPWGRMYLTYRTLSDLRGIFADPTRARAFAAFADPNAVALLRQFVTDHALTKAGESAAFLEIDLDKEEAGWLPSTDVDGTIKRLNWQPEDVAKVAQTLDRYLKTNASVVDYAASLTTRTDVVGSWQQLQGLTTNALIAPRLASTAYNAFFALVDRRPDALKQLEINDAALAKKIREFRKTAYPPEQSGSDVNGDAFALLAPTYIREFPKGDDWAYYQFTTSDWNSTNTAQTTATTTTMFDTTGTGTMGMSDFTSTTGTMKDTFTRDIMTVTSDTVATDSTQTTTR